jgi:hypothetical protein
MIPEKHRPISPGTILVEKSTLLPGSLGLDSDLSGGGWARVTDNPDRQQIEKNLAAAGWTFFLMSGAIKTLGFGFARPQMIQAALKRLIASVRLQRCNCLEIDAISTRSFLGIPYVCISAHSRHIQSGFVFVNHTGITA